MKRVFSQIVNELNPKLEISKDMFTGNKKITIYNAREVLNASYSNIKKSLKAMNTKQVGFVDDKKESFRFITPFPSVAYSDNTVDIIVFEDVLPQLMEMRKGFTRYQLDSAMSLSSTNSLRLYEILSSWKDLESHPIEIGDLLVQMNLDKEDSYQKWKEFHKVIKRCQTEINDKTDIKFTFEPKKRGRKTTTILFHISENDKKSDLSQTHETPTTDKSKRINEILDEIGISRADYRNKVLGKQEEFWKWNAHYRKNKATIKIPAGHLVKTLDLNK